MGDARGQEGFLPDPTTQVGKRLLQATDQLRTVVVLVHRQAGVVIAQRLRGFIRRTHQPAAKGLL